jgi:hypothetical protein
MTPQDPKPVSVPVGESAAVPNQPEQPKPEPVLQLSKEEAALVGKLFDRLIQSALVDAIATVVTPALKKSLATALSETAAAVNASRTKPGGGTDGTGSSQGKGPDGPP